MRLLAPLLLAAFLAPALSAALPDAVRQACFSATVRNEAGGDAWRVLSWDAWLDAPLQISEGAEGTLAVAEGAPSPAGDARTAVALLMPPQTDATPCPVQRLTLSVTLADARPEASYELCLVAGAALPPCQVKQWGRRLALVADAGDWYVAAEDPEATITLGKEAQGRRATLRVAGRKAKGAAPASAALLVGEGPLPPPLP